MSTVKRSVRELRSYFLAPALEVQVERVAQGHQYHLIHVNASGTVHSIHIGDLGNPDHLKPTHAHKLSEAHQRLLGIVVRILMRVGRRPADHGLDASQFAKFVQSEDVERVVSLIPVKRKLTQARLQLNTLAERKTAGELIAGWPLAKAVVLALCNPNLGSRVVSVRLEDELAKFLDELAASQGCTVGQLLRSLVEEKKLRKIAAQQRSPQTIVLEGGADGTQG